MTDDIDADADADLDLELIDRVRSIVWPCGSSGGEPYERGLVGDMMGLLSDIEGGEAEARRVVAACLLAAFPGSSGRERH